MRCFQGIGRSLGIVILLLTGCTIEGFYSSRGALAQPIYPKAVNSIDHLCYMQTKDGQIINLSEWCVRKPVESLISGLSGVDQQFLQGYQSLLQKRAKVSPVVQALLAESQKNPRSMVDRAKAACTGVGQSQRTSDQVTDYLFQAMALKRYCPGRDD